MLKIIYLSLIIFSYCLQAKPLKTDVSVPIAVLINAETGAVLFEKNAHLVMQPASITKIATALYALERKGNNLDFLITASQDAVGAIPEKTRMANPLKYPPYRLEVGGTHIGIKVGEVLSFRTLLYGLMLCSGNDAANVIAEYVSGNIGKFAEELNAFLKKNGITTTTFHNAHGLPYPDHVTTAYEMAKITALAMKNPTFREIVKTVRYTRPQTNKQPESYLLQSNKLLKSGTSFYPKAIGVKTGYSSLAGLNLVAAAEHEGRVLIAVLLNGQDIYQRYRDAIGLFETAFSEVKTTRTLFTKEYDHFSIPIKGGKIPLEAALLEDLKITYYPSEEPNFKTVLHWNKSQMPIVKNQLVGEIRVISDTNILLKTAPIYASRDVPKTTWFRLKEIFSDQITLIVLLMLLTTGLGFFTLKQKESE